MSRTDRMRRVAASALAWVPLAIIAVTAIAWVPQLPADIEVRWMPSGEVSGMQPTWVLLVSMLAPALIGAVVASIEPTRISVWFGAGFGAVFAGIWMLVVAAAFGGGPEPLFPWMAASVLLALLGGIPALVLPPERRAVELPETVASPAGQATVSGNSTTAGEGAPGHPFAGGG